MASTLPPALQHLAADPTTTEAQVRGVLAALFQALSSQIGAAKYENLFHDQGWCDLDALELLVHSDVAAMMPAKPGHAARIYNALSTPPIVMSSPLAPPLNIPKHGPAYPDTNERGRCKSKDLLGFLPKLRSYIKPRVDALCLSEFDGLIVDPSKPTSDTGPSPAPDRVVQSEFVWDALLASGSEGIPTSVVTALPAQIVQNRQGMAAL